MQAPDELRSLPGWVIWRYEGGDDGAKPRKVPYYAVGGKRHGAQGRPEDRAHLVGFDAACAAAARRGFDGVGLCLMPDFGIVVLDFDAAVTNQGLHPELAALVGDTYTEFSPSGTGVHAIYRGNMGDRKSHADGEHFGVETFSSKGFVTFTGNALSHVADLDLVGPLIAPVSEGVRALCAARFGRRDDADGDPLMTYSPPLGLSEAELLDILAQLDPSIGHDPWLQVGMALHHETAGERFDLWDDWSSQDDAGYPGREELSKRWESFGKAGGVKVTARTLLKMVKVDGSQVLTAEALREAPGPTQADKAPRFAFQQAAEFVLRKPVSWLIKGVLPKGDVGAVFGESGAGKSFFALDLVMAVATGTAWKGHEVRQQGAVAYVCAEGAGGFTRRIQAYADHHGIDLAAAPLYVLGDAPNLIEIKDVKALGAALKVLPPLQVIVVDTLAQVTPGANENSGEDMGRALAHCRALAQATGALVLLVAHAGKDAGRGLRGWSGIKGALDVEIQVERSDKYRSATITKMKDGEGEGDEFAFSLVTVSMGQDEDGDEITSCVLQHGASVPHAHRKAEPKGAVQQLVLRVAVGLTDLPGAVTTSQLIDAVVNELPKPDGKRDQRRATVLRAVEALVGSNVMSVGGGEVNLL